jgi:hypothetical protein
VDVQAAARAWANAWERAWRTLDPGPLEAVYADEAVHRSHPFREPGSPLDYARWAFAEEEGEPEVWFSEPVAAGDRAAVEWWAVAIENGELVTLAGTSVLRLGEDGRVVEQADYWATAPGRTPPWAGWGGR